MPRTYRKRKPYKKALTVVKRPRTRITRNILPIGFPDTHLCKLRYNMIKTLDPDGLTGLVAYDNITINSAYDCDTQIGGGAPAYYDQLSLIYNRYKVLSAKVVMTPLLNVAPTGVNSQVPCCYGLIRGEDNTNQFVNYTWNDIQAQYGKSSSIRINQAGGNAVYTIDKPAILTWSLKKDVGTAYSKDIDYSALVNTNPAKPKYVTYFAVPPQSGIESTSQIFNIYLEMVVLFTDRKRITDA